ncbi:hypothetical protein HNQ71_002220 [Mesorhizobium sangaii]|uniref:Lytic murein transglycosylase n=1 Tax=Mesorhizobium sangaii TaxID=505389 RepID=A0A841PM56_9HYPH|nr:hypothetical protein [Mesorhizobium sangaii]
MSHWLSPVSNAKKWAARSRLPISPFEGEMSDRTEGGALARPDICFAGIA